MSLEEKNADNNKSDKRDNWKEGEGRNDEKTTHFSSFSLINCTSNAFQMKFLLNLYFIAFLPRMCSLYTI